MTSKKEKKRPLSKLPDQYAGANSDDEKTERMKRRAEGRRDCRRCGKDTERRRQRGVEVAWGGGGETCCRDLSRTAKSGTRIARNTGALDMKNRGRMHN